MLGYEAGLRPTAWWERCRVAGLRVAKRWWLPLVIASTRLGSAWRRIEPITSPLLKMIIKKRREPEVLQWVIIFPHCASVLSWDGFPCVPSWKQRGSGSTTQQGWAGGPMLLCNKRSIGPPSKNVKLPRQHQSKMESSAVVDCCLSGKTGAHCSDSAAVGRWGCGSPRLQSEQFSVDNKKKNKNKHTIPQKLSH